MAKTPGGQAFVRFSSRVPLFIAQLILLRIAEFPVLHAIPGLLYVHLLFFVAIVLPALTIASVTSGVGQAALAMLAILLVIIGIVLLSTVMTDMDLLTDATDTLQAAIFLTVCITTVLVQYIYRKTFTTRSLVSGGVLAIFLVIVLAPYEKLIRRLIRYPRISCWIGIRRSLTKKGNARITLEMKWSWSFRFK
jgi:hypothetical protein